MGLPPFEHRPGPKPAVDDTGMMEWLDEQETNNLTLYKGEIIQEAYRCICEQENPEYAASVFKSGETWWRRFKTKLLARTPQLVESQRAHARLTEELVDVLQ